jgi:plastocyanin
MGAIRTSALALTIAVGAAGATTAGAAPPRHESTANGNIITGGLSFEPADLAVAVGDVIAWKNTDFLVPHTVTEAHGLWDLTGGYGATPINPAGFGPGTVAERRFEAGTQSYFCRVHPVEMVGKISVPVTVTTARSKHPRKRGRGRARTISTVTMVWAADPPADGLGFDVERRLPDGAWSRIGDRTTATSGTFRTRPGTVWEIRARLRTTKGREAGTGFSPPVTITA